MLRHSTISFTDCHAFANYYLGAAVAKWLSSWLEEQEDRVRFLALPLEFSEIGYLLLPSPDMAERLLNRR